MRASRATHIPDAASDVVLRGFEDGSEGGTAMEQPIPLARIGAEQIGIDPAVGQGTAEAVIHVIKCDLANAEAHLQILTCVQAFGGGGQQVLITVPLIERGQLVVPVSFEHVPETHRFIASRLVITGEGTADVDYSCWLRGARAR